MCGPLCGNRSVIKVSNITIIMIIDNIIIVCALRVLCITVFLLGMGPEHKQTSRAHTQESYLTLLGHLGFLQRGPCADRIAENWRVIKVSNIIRVHVLCACSVTVFLEGGRGAEHAEHTHKNNI